MSWFGRESPLRSSLSRRKNSFTPFQKIQEGTCLEVFRSHWQQAWSIMKKYGPGQQPNSPLADDVSAIVNLLDQMTTLLMQEAQQLVSRENHSSNAEFKTVSPILDYFLEEGCLSKLLNWSTHTGEFVNLLKVEQLKLYEILVTNCHKDLLFHKPVVSSLLRLLSSCKECSPVDVEKRLVVLLNSLCVCITQCPDLLQVFFHASSDHGSTRSENPRDMFLIFSLLIPFVHREGCIGQQARDALLLCMSLSRKNESIGVYIAEHSNFCPILATGLSGLYSVLPRKLGGLSEDWHCFTQEDITDMPEVTMFLNSLEFCNAVVQVAHPLVQDQLLEYLYQGFLVPVLGPALHQDAVGVPISCLENSSRYLSTVEEIIVTTAYLELFIRTVTEPVLLQVFLKFVLTASHDDHDILSTLIDRLGAQGQLCLVTMSLFQRLLDLNCEDVLFQLVFRFLIPCCHIMVSQRSRIRDIDVYSISADNFLSLIPNCCSAFQAVTTLDNDHKIPVVTNFYSRPIVSGELRSISVGEKLSRGGSLRVRSYPRSPSTSSFAFGEFDSLPVNLRRKCCEPPSEMLNSSYLDYLKAAHERVKSCALSCRTWSFLYDGCDPLPDAFSAQIKDTIELDKKNSVVCNGFHPSLVERTGNSSEQENVIQESKTKSELLVTKSSLAKGNTSSADLVMHSKENDKIVSSLCTDGAEKIAVTKELTCKENRIISQLMETDDENEFWNLVNETDTPSSVSDLDENLEFIENCLKDTEVSIKSEVKLNVNNVYVGCKEESSNLDSGVFELRESSNSSEADPENGAKSKLTINSSSSVKVNCPQMKDSGKAISSTAHKVNAHSNSSWELFGSPDVGPFLSILLTRLEMMMQNDLYTNLHLTGLIMRLACYPQPLLRSFLLNHSLVFQPTIRSLFQVLGSLKQKVDSFSFTVENFDDLLFQSRKFLLTRDRMFMESGSKSMQAPLIKRMSLGQNISSPLQRGETRRRSLTNFLFRRGTFLKGKVLSKEPCLESIADNQGYRFYAKPSSDALEGEMESVKIKNAVFCAVILEEFLKELAAIALEHSVIQLDPDFWDKKWHCLL